MIKELPAGTIDGIIQGHMHYFSHHFIEGIPVLGTVDSGKYFNILHLTFLDDKISQSMIEGPVPIC